MFRACRHLQQQADFYLIILYVNSDEKTADATKSPTKNTRFYVEKMPRFSLETDTILL